MEQVSLQVGAGPAQTLAALLGRDAPGAGAALPPLWHWASLATWAPAEQTGPDGHPQVGGFLPDTGLPRRMFAGGRLELTGDVVVGEQVTRESEVLSVTPKEGRSGRLVIVVAEHRFRNTEGQVVLREQQDLVYREAAAIPENAHAPVAPEPVAIAESLVRRNAAWDWEFATDPTKLMRYSSATANGHRIHYDLPYATGVEGYPGLVVHGPLMITALAHVFATELPEAVVTALEHRALRPLFCGQPARVVAEHRDGEVELSLQSASPERVTHCTLLLSHTR